ncbi:unnamed protein product [Clonostachys rosea]|uniref:C2H2-type domain-containing protein n=1 Tax=Bionectria ochroleuca TaxID=29856 RepID=A0ABY6UV10_BIOOC|nr:unnamed protein product [Clonostachys rosea]
MSLSSADHQQPSSETEVATEVVHVRERFIQVLSLGSAASYNDGPLSKTSAQDMLDRFNLWAGSLGATHHSISRLSLEQRLVQAPEVLLHIREHLSEMQESLEDGEIAECIRSLFRIALVVKSASSRDRFAKALAATQFAFMDQFDINYVAEKFPKLQMTEQSWLRDRLGSAIAKRRQFIKYCYEHKRRLDSGPDEDPAGKQSTKATTLDVTKLKDKAIDSQDEDEDGDVASIMTSTTVSDRTNALSLQKLAALSPEGQPFECPICSTLQSFKSDRAWRAHAFRDLKPYLCTRGSTEDCGRLFFADRSSWFQHELSMHLSPYKCSLCGDKSASGRPWLQKHFAKSHPKLKKDQLKTLIDMGEEAPRSFPAQDCPFCDEWAVLLRKRHGQAPPLNVSITRFKRHVATHQEDLALFAMPRNPDIGSYDSLAGTSASSDEDEEEEGSDDSSGRYRKKRIEELAAEDQTLHERLQKDMEDMPPSPDPEKIRLEVELAAYKKVREIAEADEGRTELEMQIRKDAEEAFHRRMEEMRRAQEEAKKEIEKAKKAAERAARERIAAEKKAEKGRAPSQGEAAEKSSVHGPMIFEEQRKAVSSLSFQNELLEVLERDHPIEFEGDMKPPPDPEKLKLETELKAFKAAQEQARAAERQRKLEAPIRKDAEDAFQRRMEDARERIEAERKAEEERQKAHAAAMAQAEEAARKRFEAEMKAHVERKSAEAEARKRAEEEAQRRLEAAIKAELEAKAAAAKKVAEEAERLKKIEADAKAEAKAEATRKVVEEEQLLKRRQGDYEWGDGTSPLLSELFKSRDSTRKDVAEEPSSEQQEARKLIQKAAEIEAETERLRRTYGAAAKPPTEQDGKGKGISELTNSEDRVKVPPEGARWTKIAREIVNPEALTVGRERFEVRGDSVIVMRVLSKEEIQAYATATQIGDERKEQKHSSII